MREEDSGRGLTMVEDGISCSREGECGEDLARTEVVWI